MAIPYRATGKSLKKAVAKVKKPAGKVVVQSTPKGRNPFFTPPGMEVESAAEDRSKGEEKD